MRRPSTLTVSGTRPGYELAGLDVRAGAGPTTAAVLVGADGARSASAPLLPRRAADTARRGHCMGEGLWGEGGGTGFSTRDTSWALAPLVGSRYLVSTDTFIS